MKEYILAKNVILREDNPYKTEYTATLVDDGKVYKMNEEGYKLLEALSSKKSLEEFFENYINIVPAHQEKCSVKQKVVNFIESGIDMGLITTEIHNCQYITRIPPPKFKFKLPSFNFPEEVILSMTGKCNLNCKHCMALDVSSMGNSFSYTRLLQLLDEFDEYGLKILKISGRESTLYEKIWEFLTYAATKRFALVLLTNGTTLTNDQILIISEIKKNRKNGFNIAISLDGSNVLEHEFIRGENTFNRTISCVKKLIDNGVNPCINTVIHSKNVMAIENLILFCISLGLQHINFSMLFDIGAKRTNSDIGLSIQETKYIIKTMPRIIEKYHNRISMNFDTKHLRTTYPNSFESEALNFPKNVCNAGIASMYINHDGNVYPCVEGAGIKELVVGNVLNNSVKDIWDSTSWHLYRGGWDIQDLPNCQNCHETRMCNLVSCRIYPMAQGRDFYGTPKNCKVLY